MGGTRHHWVSLFLFLLIFLALYHASTIRDSGAEEEGRGGRCAQAATPRENVGSHHHQGIPKVLGSSRRPTGQGCGDFEASPLAELFGGPGTKVALTKDDGDISSPWWPSRILAMRQVPLMAQGVSSVLSELWRTLGAVLGGRLPGSVDAEVRQSAAPASTAASTSSFSASLPQTQSGRSSSFFRWGQGRQEQGWRQGRSGLCRALMAGAIATVDVGVYSTSGASALDTGSGGGQLAGGSYGLFEGSLCHHNASSSSGRAAGQARCRPWQGSHQDDPLAYFPDGQCSEGAGCHSEAKSGSCGVLARVCDAGHGSHREGSGHLPRKTEGVRRTREGGLQPAGDSSGGDQGAHKFPRDCRQSIQCGDRRPCGGRLRSRTTSRRGGDRDRHRSAGYQKTQGRASKCRGRPPRRGGEHSEKADSHQGGAPRLGCSHFSFGSSAEHECRADGDERPSREHDPRGPSGLRFDTVEPYNHSVFQLRDFISPFLATLHGALWHLLVGWDGSDVEAQFIGGIKFYDLFKGQDADQNRSQGRCASGRLTPGAQLGFVGASGDMDNTSRVEPRIYNCALVAAAEEAHVPTLYEAAEVEDGVHRSVQARTVSANESPVQSSRSGCLLRPSLSSRATGPAGLAAGRSLRRVRFSAAISFWFPAELEGLPCSDRTPLPSSQCLLGKATLEGRFDPAPALRPVAPSDGPCCLPRPSQDAAICTLAWHQTVQGGSCRSLQSLATKPVPFPDEPWPPCTPVPQCNAVLGGSHRSPQSSDCIAPLPAGPFTGPTRAGVFTLDSFVPAVQGGSCRSLQPSSPPLPLTPLCATVQGGSCRSLQSAAGHIGSAAMASVSLPDISGGVFGAPVDNYQVEWPLLAEAFKGKMRIGHPSRCGGLKGCAPLVRTDAGGLEVPFPILRAPRRNRPRAKTTPIRMGTSPYVPPVQTSRTIHGAALDQGHALSSRPVLATAAEDEHTRPYSVFAAAFTHKLLPAQAHWMEWKYITNAITHSGLPGQPTGHMMRHTVRDIHSLKWL